MLSVLSATLSYNTRFADTDDNVNLLHMVTPGIVVYGAVYYSCIWCRLLASCLSVYGAAYCAVLSNNCDV